MAGRGDSKEGGEPAQGAAGGGGTAGLQARLGKPYLEGVGDSGMNQSYETYIAERAERLHSKSQGIAVTDGDIHPALYPFQRAITRRALQLGNAALFEDCGMGKTIQELEWARHVTAKTGKPVLVFAPLAVGPQMVQEGKLIDYPVHLARHQGRRGRAGGGHQLRDDAAL